MKMTVFHVLLITVALMSAGRTYAVDKAEKSTILFEDDFAKLDPGWDIIGDTHTEKNKLIVQPPPSKTYITLYKANLFDDMDASVDVHLAKGTSAAGLTFWGTDTENCYFAEVLPLTGQYCVGRYLKNRLLFPVTWRDSNLVKKTPDALNKLRVVTKGSSATIFINGKEMITFKGQPPDGGGFIGTIAGSNDDQNSWEFSNLIIKNPAP